jgi:hypothetical protein
MAALPEPKVGLVISYSYLWSEEAAQGHVEGRKTRPCAIILVVESLPTAESDKGRQVAVVPITHFPPNNPNVAVEIPARVKQHLGLDSERSWIIVDELNVFAWPGYDLRPISRYVDRVEYGFLPPKLFDQVINKFSELYAKHEVSETSRDDSE